MALDQLELSKIDHHMFAVGAADMKDLIDNLASTHHLTAAEASEIIEEWQAGLSLPGGDLAA